MSTLQLKSGESKALPWAINLDAETGKVTEGSDRDVLEVLDFIHRGQYSSVSVAEVLADPTRALGLYPRVCPTYGGDPETYLSPVGAAHVYRTFAEYLATLAPVRTIEVDGDPFDIFDLDDIDAWVAWVDPKGQVEDFEGYANLTDYVPSMALWYATVEGESTRWGSGESEEEAAYEALTRR